MDEFGKWAASHVEPHGRVNIQVKTCNSAASQLGLAKLKNKKSVAVSALCDTGAQMCVSDWSTAKEMGISKSDILTPALTISTADNAKLELIGATFLTLYSNSGQSTDQLVYFANGVGQFYLSKSAMKDLGIINRDFPKIGSCINKQVENNHDDDDNVDNEEDDVFAEVQQLQVGAPLQHSHLHVAPPPYSLPVPHHAPSAPEGNFMPPVPAGETRLQSLVNHTHGGQVPSQRGEPPVSGHVHAPQGPQQFLPSPYSLPLDDQQQPASLYRDSGKFKLNFQAQKDGTNGALTKVGQQQSAAHTPAQGYPNNFLNQDNLSAAGHQQGMVAGQTVGCEDIGADWQQEFPSMQPWSGSWPLPPDPPPPPPPHSSQQVHTPKYDKLGRELAPCGCLKHLPPPPPTTVPPCAITPDNVHEIEKWFLNTYAASAFNVCPHQPLPLMTGLPPHVKEDSDPVAIHRPSTIPAHWVEDVRRELERDIALGVIERVPSNTPTTWCSRMHVVGKKTSGQ